MIELFQWLEAHPALASWAQTIGAFIALAIAIAIPQAQLNEARRQLRGQRHERAIQLFDAMGAMANFAGQVFYDANAALGSENLTEGVVYSYHPSELDGVAKAFETYPLHELPDHDSVATALKMKACFEHARNYLQLAVEHLSDGEVADHLDSLNFFNAYLDEYSEFVAEFSGHADDYREKMRSSYSW